MRLDDVMMVTRPTRWFSGWGTPHLSEESLVELHTLLVAGEARVAARYLRHLRECDDCADRFEQVRAMCDELGADVRAAADSRIATSRLDRQLDVIMRRLEGQSGRVLPFPVGAHRTAPAPVLNRWVAVAAACGLTIGLAAGFLVDLYGGHPSQRWLAGRSTSVPPKPSLPDGVELEADEQMLAEIDHALARSRTKEFRALDSLTPRVSESRSRGR